MARLTFLAVALFIALAANAQKATLTITFTNIEKAKGNIMIALKSADSSHVTGFVVPVKNTGELTYKINDLVPGKYAVQVFHDVNSDEKLNTNMMGIPNEPYGFSNNARGTFGPPNLADQLFSFPEKSAIRIKLE